MLSHEETIAQLTEQLGNQEAANRALEQVRKMQRESTNTILMILILHISRALRRFTLYRGYNSPP